MSNFIERLLKTPLYFSKKEFDYIEGMSSYRGIGSRLLIYRAKPEFRKKYIKDFGKYEWETIY